jgi:hypothetical protein
MLRHQAPRSWAKTRVTELPARARWAPSGAGTVRPEGRPRCERAATGTAAQPKQSRPTSGQTSSGRGAPPGRIQQAQRCKQREEPGNT